MGKKLHKTDKHHAWPRSRWPEGKPGRDDPHNIRHVPPKKHAYYHALFGNMTPEEIARYLTDSWISRDWYLVAIPKKKKSPKRYRRTSEISCDDCGKKCTIHHTKKEVTKKL